jgi:hypothetical protein
MRADGRAHAPHNEALVSEVPGSRGMRRYRTSQTARRRGRQHVSMLEPEPEPEGEWQALRESREPFNRLSGTRWLAPGARVRARLPQLASTVTNGHRIGVRLTPHSAKVLLPRRAL